MHVAWLDQLTKTVAIGLKSAGETIYLAEISQNRGQLEIHRLEKFEKQEHVKPLYMGTPILITAIDASDVLVRQLDLKLKKRKDIDAVVAFQSEPLIPYPIENAILQWTVAPTDEGSQATVMAVRKDHLEKHLESWKTLKIEPEVVVATPNALLAFSHYVMSVESPLFWIHVEKHETTCLLFKQKELVAVKAIALPSSASEELKMEVIRTLYALAKQIKNEIVENIAFSGDLKDFAASEEVVCATLKVRKKDYIVPQRCRFTTEELSAFAIPLGAALCGLVNTSDPIDFRRETYAYPYPWKRLLQPLLVYFGLCLLVSVFLFVLGQVYMAHQLAKVRGEYAELLILMNKPHEDFEAVFSSSPSVIGKLTASQMQERIEALDREVLALPQTYPLVPGVPRVSDVLAWLSVHPQVTGNEASEALQLESFAYTMVKRPDQTKKNERYQVKVDLEFTSPTPKAAREFHDALIAPNAFVDPKSEIKWSTNRGRYTTSFFLKDNTSYTGY